MVRGAAAYPGSAARAVLMPGALLLPPALFPLQLPHKGFQNEGRDGVAVLLPAGTYRITKMVEIYQSNVVLRGEGVRNRTLLLKVSFTPLWDASLQRSGPTRWPPSAGPASRAAG